MAGPERPVRRRRAVGPRGSVPAAPDDDVPGGVLGGVVREVAGDASARDHEAERPPQDDDERLRRDVPPHHGG